MATKPVELIINADASGATKGIAGLEGNLRELANVLEGDLKVKALASADALAQLGSKKDAIDGFKALRTEARELGTAMDAASQKVEQLGAELPRVSTAAKSLAAAQSAASTEMTAAKAVLDEQRAALTKLNADYKSGAISQTDYKEASAQLKVTIADLRENLNQKKAALNTATQAAREGATAEKELTADYKKAVTAASAVSAEVGNKSRELDKSRAALKAVGLETAGLADSERKLKAELAATTSEAQKLVPALTQAGQKVKALDDGSKQATQSAGGMGNAFRELGPIIAAAFSGRELVNTIVSAESLKLGLTAILGSSQAAAAELAFLKETSNELGLELQSTGQQYLSLTAATKGTTLEGEQTRQVFTAISRAMSVLGKSSAESERALQAVSQMASKGTVSMEELRGQLGEALPGALKAAADGAGITTSQLIKMVENGDVLAKDLLPALAKGLDAIYAKGGPPDTLIANFNRFKNVVTETAVAIGEGGGGKTLSGGVGLASKALVGFSEFSHLSADAVGQLAAAIATGSLSSFDLSAALEVSANRINRVKEAVDGAEPAIATMGSASTSAGTSAQEAFRKMEIAAQNATSSVIANRQVYTDREEAIKKSLEVADKAVKASESEAKVLNLVASAFGSETEKRQAATLASQLQEQAQNQLILVKRVELDIAQQKLAQLVNETRGIKELDDATKKQKEEMQQSVKVKTEEVRAAEAVGKTHEITTTQLKASADAFKDNSGRVYELRGAMVAANEAAARLHNEYIKGKATLEQVTAADLAAQQATYLYRDAMNDLVTASKIKEQQLAQKNVTQQKENDLNVEAITSTLELANARGNDSAATKAQEALTQALVAAKRDAAGALRAEAEATRATADAEEAAARATGGLTTEKKAEIEALRESAKQKDLDAQKSDLLASREEQLAKSVDGTTSALERKNAAQERANAATEKAIALEDKRLNRDKEGFSLDTGGKRVNMDVQNQRSVYENAKSQGLDEAQALQISRQFIDSLGRQIGGAQANSAKGENWGTELQKAIDKQVLRNAGSKATSTSAEPKVTQPPLDLATANANALAAAGALPGETVEQALQRQKSGEAKATGATTDTSALIADYQQQLNSAIARGDTGDIADLKADIADLKRNAPTTSVHITLDRGPQIVNTDAAGARVLQDLLSQLGNAKSSSSLR